MEALIKNLAEKHAEEMGEMLFDFHIDMLKDYGPSHMNNLNADAYHLPALNSTLVDYLQEDFFSGIFGEGSFEEDNTLANLMAKHCADKVQQVLQNLYFEKMVAA